MFFDPPLTPVKLLIAYRMGFFPMADPDDGAIYWNAPDPRAILPFERFHIPHGLRRVLARQPFEVTFDRAFETVMRACAERDPTWISEELVQIYSELHRMGYAHSVECWQREDLVGGLYGVALGGAFFGESMFHRTPEASKVALVHLVHLLEKRGFILHDIQMWTPHLARFGATEVSDEAFSELLENAIDLGRCW